MGRTVLMAGHAKLPQKMAARNVYESLTITAEVDPVYGVIVKASCTLATPHAREFFGELLRGYSLREGLEPIADAIRSAYHGKAQSALLAAAKDLHQQFLAFQAQKKTCS